MVFLTGVPVIKASDQMPRSRGERGWTKILTFSIEPTAPCRTQLASTHENANFPHGVVWGKAKVSCREGDEMAGGQGDQGGAISTGAEV